MQLKFLSLVLVVSSSFVVQALPTKRDLPGQILRLDASQVHKFMCKRGKHRQTVN